MSQSNNQSNQKGKGSDKKSVSAQIRQYRPIRIDKGTAMIRFEFDNQEGRPLKCKLIAAPAMENMRGRRPGKGQAKYDYDNAQILHLDYQECFQIAGLFDLFLGGRFPAFAKAADKRKFSRHIIHDPSLTLGYKGPRVKKIIEIDHKDGFRVFFRVKTRENGENGNEIENVIVVLDYWEVKMLSVMMIEIGRTLLGFNQMNITPKFDNSGGNITEPLRLATVTEIHNNDSHRPDNDFGDIPIASEG